MLNSAALRLASERLYSLEAVRHDLQPLKPAESLIVVPSAVRIVDPEGDSMRRVELRFSGGW